MRIATVWDRYAPVPSVRAQLTRASRQTQRLVDQRRGVLHVGLGDSDRQAIAGLVMQTMGAIPEAIGLGGWRHATEMPTDAAGSAQLIASRGTKRALSYADLLCQEGA